MNRRDFLQSVVLQSGVGLWLTSRGLHAAPSGSRPNIIYIYTDQQHARMMSCAGNPWLKTPAMDCLANNGVESEIGRMVVDQDRVKYIRYDAAGFEEQLLDLRRDPYETTHFTYDVASAA